MSDPPRPRHKYTFADYLELEEMNVTKHEYVEGEIYAMAGGTPRHAAISAAVTIALGSQLLAGPCRVFSSDLGVRVSATGMATYPDVTVVCGPLELDSEAPVKVTNPAVIVEVLSESTEEWDRLGKFEHYKQVPSLRGYVLVAQSHPEIEVRHREDDGTWTKRVWVEGQAELSGVGCSFRSTRSMRPCRAEDKPQA